MSTELLTASIIAATLVPAALALGRRFVFGRGVGRLDGQRVTVCGGYEPAEVHVAAGQPTRLTFFRAEEEPCSEHVVFPDFGLSIALPPYRDVEVELPASAPGVHEFTCEMEMLRGRLVVDEPPAMAGGPR